MFRDQVYNTVGRDRGQLSPNADTFRRLNRRIHHNMGLLNTSRSSNHSSSFRMGRTELSGDRFNSSRDREQASHHISGLPSHEINDSRGQIPKRMSSILNLGRRRLAYEGSRPLQVQPRGGKDMVETLYMLAGSQTHHSKPREGSSRAQNFEPLSPRVHNGHEFRPQSRRCEQKIKQGSSDPRIASHSRESKLRQRRGSKEQSRLRPTQYPSNSDCKNGNYLPKDRQRPQEGPIKRLEEKYLENIYELNSPRGQKQERRREKEGEPQQQVLQQQQISKNSMNSNSTNSRANYSGKNMNQYYFQQPQISSTSGGTGVRTLPDASKVETGSQASLPINSVASQKDIPSYKQIPSAKELPSKGSVSPKPHQKSSIKLDRHHRLLRKQDKEQKRKQPQYQVSSLSMRWKMNNIQLEERKEEKVSRTEKVIADEEQPLLLGSVFLPIESKREEVGREWAEDILERIILHLDCLNMIANYTKEFRKIYDSTEQWQVLIFLSYKKFYIQRTKVASTLRSLSLKKEHQEEEQLLAPSRNPFILPYSKVTDEELARFRGTRECIALRYELQAEDTQIRNALRGLYNLYIEKSGEHVNMFDCDNFSEEIYRLMLEELEGISENLEESTLLEPTKRRMGRIIQTGLLIAYLNGKYVKNFAQILLHEDTVKIGKRETLRQDCLADLYLGEFKKVLA